MKKAHWTGRYMHKSEKEIMIIFMNFFGAMPEPVVVRAPLMFFRCLRRRMRIRTRLPLISTPSQSMQQEINGRLTCIIQIQEHDRREPDQVDKDDRPRSVKLIATSKHRSNSISPILHRVMHADLPERNTPAGQDIEHELSALHSRCCVELGVVDVESIRHCLCEPTE